MSLCYKNLYSYCDNNPIIRVDITGRLWGEIWNFCKTATVEIGTSIKSLTPVYAGCGGASALDGPLPFLDAVGLVISGAATVGAIGYGIYKATQAPAVSVPKEDEKEVDIDDFEPLPPKTFIFRWGRYNPGNFTPREKDVKSGRGLSFTIIQSLGCPKTTIEDINATGIVYAVRDGSEHVSIYPVNGTMSDWFEAGSGSVWTKAVKSCVDKWRYAA